MPAGVGLWVSRACPAGHCRLLIASRTQLLCGIYENWTLLRVVIARITLWEEKRFAGEFASAAAASFSVRLPKIHNVPLIRG